MRKSIFVALALVAATQFGCRMCQNCLDYGCPVMQQECCGGCQSGGGYGECRSGSCFADKGMDAPVVAEEPTGPTILR